MNLERTFGEHPPALIRRAIKTLTYREREVIKLRYGIGDDYTYTLMEVARIFKVTRERVRQVERKAVDRIRRFLAAKEAPGEI